MKKFIFLIAALFFVNFAYSQDTLAVKKDNSLNGQYTELLKKSWGQKGYKNINQARLQNLWRNVQDSLRAEKRKYAPLETQINTQKKTIDDLKAQTAAAQQNLAQSQASVDEISFLGIPVRKSTYNMIMWGAVILLAAGLLIVIFTAGKNIREARYRRQLFDEVSEEYQNFKVKANEKEKKLARELQTERNRVEELLERNR